LIWIICLVINRRPKAERGAIRNKLGAVALEPNEPRQRKRVVPMKERALIAALLLATSPAAAQAPIAPNSQALLPGQTGELAPTQAPAQAPTTGVLCTEEMTATSLCSVAENLTRGANASK
jgi:hypothetical protein